MKLAEALMLRADMQKKIASLRERIEESGLTQEGESPREDPKQLFQEAIELLKEFERLVFAINQANLSSKLADGRSLTRAIARRDALALHHSIVQAALKGCKPDSYRYSAREIKWVTTMSIEELQAQSDALSKEIRELNAEIQKKNWEAEIEY